jgi:hypothetical protein
MATTNFKTHADHPFTEIHESPQQRTTYQRT